MLGARGPCGHRHAYLIAAAICLGNRKAKMEAAGMTTWGLAIVGPGGRVLTVEENQHLTAWERRAEDVAVDPTYGLPLDVGLMRRLRLLVTEGMMAAGLASIEAAAQFVEDAGIAGDAAAVAALIRKQAGEMARAAVKVAAMRVAREPLVATRKGPAQSGWRRDSGWEAG